MIFKKKYAMLVMCAVAIGCSTSVEASERYLFLQHLLTTLESVGNSATYVDKADLGKEIFIGQIKSVKEAALLMEVHKDSNQIEIYNAQAAVQSALFLIKEGNQEILTAYEQSLNQTENQALLDFEKVVKANNQKIVMGWKSLIMSRFHILPVLFGENPQLSSMEGNLPFKISGNERVRLVTQVSEIKNRLSQISHLSGAKSTSFILDLKEYLIFFENLLKAETIDQVVNQNRTVPKTKGTG